MLSEVIFPYETMSVSFAGGVWTEMVPTVLVVNRGLMALQVTCIPNPLLLQFPISHLYGRRCLLSMCFLQYISYNMRRKELTLLECRS
jgi:hypothetical protein